MLLCEDKLKGYTAHFRLLSAASQTRACLSSQLLGTLRSTTRWSTRTPRNKNIIGLMRKNNRAAREARILAQIRAVLCTTTTWNHQIWDFDDNVSVQMWTFGSLFLLWNCSYQFIFRILRPHCRKRTRWPNREKLTMVQRYILRWRFRRRRRRRS